MFLWNFCFTFFVCIFAFLLHKKQFLLCALVVLIQELFLFVTWQAKGKKGGALPIWLSFDEEDGVFEGVPLDNDVGHYIIRVHAVPLDGTRSGAFDDFSIEVVHRVYKPKKGATGETCPSGSDLTLASIVLNRDPMKTDGITRTSIIRNFAELFNLDMVSGMILYC